MAGPRNGVKFGPTAAPIRAFVFSIRENGAAIGLAEILKVDRLLIDDWAGRAEAVRRNLLVVGNIGHPGRGSPPATAPTSNRHLRDSNGPTSIFQPN